MLRRGQKRKSCRCSRITPAVDRARGHSRLANWRRTCTKFARLKIRTAYPWFVPRLFLVRDGVRRPESQRAAKRRWDDDNASLQPHSCKSLGSAALLPHHSPLRESPHVAWGSTYALKLYVDCLSRPRAKGTISLHRRGAALRQLTSVRPHGCIAARLDADGSERDARDRSTKRTGELLAQACSLRLNEDLETQPSCFTCNSSRWISGAPS